MNFRFSNKVAIAVDNVLLKGELVIPANAHAIIIFSHGSGSSRLSPRNRKVAQELQAKNFGTLLFDLLTKAEDGYYMNRFDIELLTRRLTGATQWLQHVPEARTCRIGFFGASTGAAAALKAAALLPGTGAVVSRGGRPDMAGEALEKATAPTLLIVGSVDHDVLELNKQAYRKLKCEKMLEVVEGASHLFEESGAMEKVSALAVAWFQQHLQPAPAPRKEIY